MASELTLVPDNLEFDPTIQGLATTQRVFGRYTLRRVLGRGGMGIVWLAFDERLEREVALKFLPDAVNFDPSALDELKRETRRCLDLTHPNILRIYDFVEDDQAAAISMEYVDGQTLAALRIEKTQRVFEVEEIAKWMEKTCIALQYAHDEAGVVHRDLKPANLMLTSRGQIKIADFGISQSVCDSISRVTMRRGSSGTLAYMSPQQMGGEKSRVTDDIYALGATIYELLTGKPPFYSGDVAFQVRLSVARSMKERRQEFEISGQEIPREWEDAVASCLAKIPEERPATMLELSERLGLSTSIMRTASGSASPLVPSLASKEAPVRALRPPPLPRPPFSSRQWLQLGGAMAALLLAGWTLWHFLVWPLTATPGELRVASVPNGATVHVSGVSDRTTPALFSHLRIGRYQVTISSEGFDPFERTLDVTVGAELNLGVVELKRAMGQLKLNTLPPHAHYLLSSSGHLGNFRKEGNTPDSLDEVPSGTYQLNLSAPGFPQSTETIQIPAHGSIIENADLIQLAASTGANPESIKAARGELNPGQLDDQGKIQLVSILEKTFNEYLNHGYLDPAAEQLSKLSQLGENIGALSSRLAARRGTMETQAASEVRVLLEEKKFATAAERLASVQATLEKPSVDRLNVLFQSTLARYREAVAAEIRGIQNVPPETAFHQMKIFASGYPDDLHLQLALARVQTNIPPSHDRLTDQLKAFQEFAKENKDFAADPDLLAMQAAFTEELRQLDALQEAVNAAQGGAPSLQSQLAHLKAKKASLRRIRVKNAQKNPFAQAVNFFGKVMVGHTVVDNGFSSQTQKDDAIAAVQSRIDDVEKQLALPTVSNGAAQNQYDEFIAHVPWGSTAPAKSSP